MKKELALLDKLEAEHKELMSGAQRLGNITSDLDAMTSLEKTSEDFAPQRTERRKQILEDLRLSLEVIDEKLSDHFNREEKDLLTLCQTRSNAAFGWALLNLVVEHGEIKNRIAKSRLDATALATEDLSPYTWVSRAYPMRFYLNHTRRRLQAHAESEQELLNALRSKLQGD
jgi:hypothetical protein